MIVLDRDREYSARARSLLEIFPDFMLVLDRDREHSARARSLLDRMLDSART